MSDANNISSTPSGARKFATTHWSVVLAAGDSSSPQHERALSTLCQTYWFPVYAYVRRQGCDVHQAEDYAQGFFAYILEKRSLRRAEPGCGKFRSFLLATLRHFLAGERDHAQAHKRGGDRKAFSLNYEFAESKYAIEPAHHLSPEKLFERHWALTVLNRTMDRLRTEWASRDKQNLFAALKVYLTLKESSVPYREAADELNMTEGAVKVAVHRLRKRYRELLRNEVAQTVATEDQVDEEIRDLFAAIAP